MFIAMGAMTDYQVHFDIYIRKCMNETNVIASARNLFQLLAGMLSSHSDAVGVHEWPSISKGPKTQVYLIE